MKRTTQKTEAKAECVAVRTQRNSKCKEAYEHWVKNPYLRLIDLSDKFAISPDHIRYWVKANGLKRPDADGVKPAVSERKQAIANAYAEAVKQGKDANWAVNRANEGRASRSVNKGDFVYYAVKNNLPELPNPKAYLSPTKYG